MISFFKITNKATLVVNNNKINNKSFPRNDVALKSGFYAAAGIPIIKNDVTIGVICIFFEKIDAREISELNTLFNYLYSTTSRKLP